MIKYKSIIKNKNTAQFNFETTANSLKCCK